MFRLYNVQAHLWNLFVKQVFEQTIMLLETIQHNTCRAISINKTTNSQSCSLPDIADDE